MDEFNGMKEDQVREVIKSHIAKGNIRLPEAVEQHGIFPLGKRHPGDYQFEYVHLHCGWGDKSSLKDPLWNTNGGFMLQWGAKGVGFGELTFTLKDGTRNEKTGELTGARCVCDSEAMSREFVVAALKHFAETVEIK